MVYIDYALREYCNGYLYVNKTFQMFGHAYSSSDLNKPILVGKQIYGGRYDCWSHNFKSKKI